MQALVALMNENEERKSWRVYMAEVLWSAAMPMYKEYPLARYTEIIDDKTKDTRTGREIINDLIAMLSEGGEA